MKDFKETFIGSLNERFNSTLIITYIFYVLLWNWKTFSLLFNVGLVDGNLFGANTKFPTVIDYIASLFNLYSTCCMPLLFTLVSIAALPHLNRLVSIYKTKQSIIRENAVKKERYDNLKQSTEDYKVLYSEQVKLQEEFEEAITKYRDVNHELNMEHSKHNNLKNTNEIHLKSIESLQSDLKQLKSSEKSNTEKIKELRAASSKNATQLKDKLDSIHRLGNKLEEIHHEAKSIRQNMKTFKDRNDLNLIMDEYSKLVDELGSVAGGLIFS